MASRNYPSVNKYPSVNYPPPRSQEQDWFTRAAKGAAESREAKRAAKVSSAMKAAEEAALRAASVPTSSAKLHEAMRQFGVSVSGIEIKSRGAGLASLTGGNNSVQVSGEAGLRAILKEVRRAKDPYAAAGEWLARVTTELGELAREYLDEE
jgi:hypothetical protein